jgi:hypothetical protein
VSGHNDAPGVISVHCRSGTGPPTRQLDEAFAALSRCPYVMNARFGLTEARCLACSTAPAFKPRNGGAVCGWGRSPHRRAYLSPAPSPSVLLTPSPRRHCAGSQGVALTACTGALRIHHLRRSYAIWLVHEGVPPNMSPVSWSREDHNSAAALHRHTDDESRILDALTDESPLCQPGLRHSPPDN